MYRVYSLATKNFQSTPLLHSSNVQFCEATPTQQNPNEICKETNQESFPTAKKCNEKNPKFQFPPQNSLQNPYQPQTLQRSLKRTPHRLLRNLWWTFVQAVPQASIWIEIKAEKSQTRLSFSSYLLNNKSTKKNSNTRYLNFGVLESYSSLEKGFLSIFQNQVRRMGCQN